MKKIVRLTENDLVRLVKKVLNENEEINKRKKVIIKDGAYIGGYTSNGEHYVLLYDDKWELYTGYDKFLTSGKIKSQLDSDYIINLGRDF